ncbi:ABC transporter substrate-binding protein [Fusibacter sp. 3D3]|uniref:ABC transporter substrate-binding protein n=1 Tax=Fusibacter sp. 3D3 TaxID=1048380 RepID=UPI00085374A1|nr:extracellular solute-binding protein [Fusibacter sp. 3D3]GAU79388.1 N-acetyl-D-glucosamine ABC transport system [Fusibacter sp. 3D3]
MFTQNFKKALSLLLVLVLMTFMLAGCAEAKETPTASAENNTNASNEPATASDEVITLKIYAQYADEDTKVPYDYAIEELAKVYPNVKLELDIQAQDDGQKLQSYAATGNLPDIFQIGAAQIETFKESGNILVLDDYVKSTGFGDKVFQSAQNLLWNKDGHAYAFPYAGNELVLIYYNKALFKQYNVKVPETYEELETAIHTFNENDIVPLAAFAKEKWITTSLFDVFATRLEPQGIKKLDSGEGKATEEAFVKAAERLHHLVEIGLLADGATNMNYDQAAALFYEGKAAMFINGQWEIAASTEKLGDTVDWMFYPTFSENQDAKMAFAGGGSAGGYAVSPYSEHQDLAAEVAAFLSEKYCEAKHLYRANPLLAVKIDPSLEPVNPYPPMMERLSEVLPDITSTTAFAWGLSNPQFKVLIEDQSQFLLTPDYSAEEFITEMNKSLERIHGQ